MFGTKFFSSYWVSFDVDRKSLTFASSSSSYEFKTPKEAIQDFNNNNRKYTSPHVLQILKNLANINDRSTFLSKTIQQSQQQNPEDQSMLEFSPNFQFIPIQSNTLVPFSHTNLVVVNNGLEALIVDPGASESGKSQLENILKNLPSNLTVFLTHHHHDHWESLSLVEKIRPNAILRGHKYTLDKVSSILKKIPLIGDSEFPIGKLIINAIYTPGHTDGHMALWEPVSRTLVPGDHIVGFGSAVLDFECGDMKQYLDTTRKMIGLDPLVALPAHGPPNYSPITLLQYYLKHRQDREDAILSSIRSGAESLDDIVRIVYKDVPESLWEVAKSNIKLHLKKLRDDGKITTPKL